MFFESTVNDSRDNDIMSSGLPSYYVAPLVGFSTLFPGTDIKKKRQSVHIAASVKCQSFLYYSLVVLMQLSYLTPNRRSLKEVLTILTIKLLEIHARGLIYFCVFVF